MAHGEHMASEADENARIRAMVMDALVFLAFQGWSAWLYLVQLVSECGQAFTNTVNG